MIRAILIVAALAACKGKGNDAPAPATASGSAPAAKPDPIANFDLPEVGDGFEPVTGDAIPVVVSPTEIVVDGKSVIPLENGLARPEDREGGAMGMKLPRLSTILAAHAELVKRTQPAAFSPDKGFPLKLVVAKTVPYRTLVEVMYSAKQKEAGFRWFQILARSKGRFVEAPIVLPDSTAVAQADLLEDTGKRRPGADLAKQIEGVREGKSDKSDKSDKPGSATVAPSPPPPPATHPDNMPVRLVVALTKDDTILWSMSGLEGTLPNPKLKVSPSDLAPLKKELDQIVQSRWAGKKEREQTILIMADPAIPMQRIAETIAAVRPAFPDINFATGFE